LYTRAPANDARNEGRKRVDGLLIELADARIAAR
jgi:hypothetical protein